MLIQFVIFYNLVAVSVQNQFLVLLIFSLNLSIMQDTLIYGFDEYAEVMEMQVVFH